MKTITDTARHLFELGDYYWSEEKYKTHRKPSREPIIDLDELEDSQNSGISCSKDFKKKKDASEKPKVENPKVLIARVREDLAAFNLDDEDILLIAAAYFRTIPQNNNISALDLLGHVFKAHLEQLENIDRIKKLVIKKILNPDEKRYRRRVGNKVEFSMDRTSMLDMYINLHPNFVRHLLNDKIESISSMDSPYRDNRDYLKDLFTWVEAYKSYNLEMRNYLDEEDTVDRLAELNEQEERIASRMKKTTEKFPIQEIIADYSLDRKEEAIIVYMLKELLENNGCSEEELLDLISEDKFSRLQNSRYIERDSKLVKRGLIEIHRHSFFNMHGQNLRLSPDVAMRLLKNQPKTDQERMREVLDGNSIFKLVTAKQTLDDLILPNKVKDSIVTAIKQNNRNVLEKLSGWGLSNDNFIQDGFEETEVKPSLLMLLYGVPGTGKTFAAGAIANSMNKQLLVTDISQILSCWVGESEQNVRKIFDQYQHIVRWTKNPPILLLNECDQFLGARGDTSRSVDKMYNQMQNLFLEAFERFSGTLIATTNLRENLDDAFSRRFHFKLEFPFPEAEERKQIWRRTIPKTLPVSKDVSFESLAEKYALTGGQISVVIKNAAVEAAQNGHKKVTMSILDKYADLEYKTSFDKKSNLRIGFRNY